MVVKPDHEALVVGTGFGGLSALYFLKKQGIDVKGVDTAANVGGTWFWNRYPGARSDVESYIYRLSFDKEHLQSSKWSHNYLLQPELEAYFQELAHKQDLYKHIQFNTQLTAATWDEENGVWKVEFSTGEKLTTRYIVSAIGILHKPKIPSFPGIETFKGTKVHSATWTPEIEYKDKRIAVIGTGASGVQLTGSLSEHAKSLTQFVRHAQYVLPASLKPIGTEERSLINARYNQIWNDAFASSVAMGFAEPNRPTLSVSAEDREAIFQDLWDQGSGFRFLFGGFSDLAVSEDANKEAIAFIHKKIREIVQDPQKVDALTSSDWFARRPLTDDRYYKAFTQANVSVVDVKKTPITTFVPEGIQTADGKVHEFDLVVFATGFDSVDGSYYAIDFKGKSDSQLPTHWADGPKSNLGLTTTNFPNLFFVNGPLAPFANNPPVAEDTARVSAELIAHAEELLKNGQGKGVVESTVEAEQNWTKATRDVANATLFSKTSSWFFGENIEGRTVSPRFWFGGVGRWRAAVAESKKNGWAGFTFT